MSLSQHTYLFKLLIIIPKGLSQLVETQQVVTVTLGGDAHFSCRLMEPKDVLQVTWQKETPRGTENVATYNKRFGTKVNPHFQGKVEFLYVGLQNCSIIIRGVSREDESCYRCLFNTYPDGAISGRTCLQAIELYGPTLLITQTNESHTFTSELTVSCSATGRPAPIVSWDETLHFPWETSSIINVTHSNGSVTVTISLMTAVSSLQENDTMVRCVVSSGTDIREDSIKIPTFITGPSSPPFTNDDQIRGHVGAVMGLVILTALICSIVWCLRQRKREERKRDNNTGAAVDEQKSRDVQATKAEGTRTAGDTGDQEVLVKQEEEPQRQE
ncbi:hypothetical protein DPEC_G00155740 [Dallia pectoralis]|uniref:Uncharacterized protein n=1 Tax=Dallia pectoralis TaxID=75939 RepID=A0ACC2GKV5_DALPE|nr:hypothetical protein DPEC_G00155740 [Dallia pectoralis]